jgi:hypothetical protein
MVLGQNAFAPPPTESLGSSHPPRRPCAGAGALSPEKGGALRKQSTQGRRLGVAAVLCGAVFVAPLLLLQHGSAHASRVATGDDGATSPHGDARSSSYSVVLPSQVVNYEAARPGSTTSTTVGPPLPVTAPTTAPVTTSTTAPVVPVPQQSAAREVEVPVTTTTVAPKAAPLSASPAASGDDEHGQATWYAAAPAGKCASPTLPFGTVLTVTNVDTGASTTCTVDDREQAGYPRVVDMSPSGFAQLASPSQGVVDVTISW